MSIFEHAQADEIAILRARIRELEAELQDESPGTPLGRLKGIADFAIAKGWCNGMEAKPAELFVIERAELVERDAKAT